VIVFSTKADLDDYVRRVGLAWVSQHETDTIEECDRTTRPLSPPMASSIKVVASRLAKKLGDRVRFDPMPDVPLPL
jgi:hypothetical protein